MAGTIVAGTLSDGTYSGSVTDTVRGACKAWVNFNGTGTVAIRASYNVSSITDNGVGSYTVNFTNSMPDVNYGFSCTDSRGGSWVTTCYIKGGLETTSSVIFESVDSRNATPYDTSHMSVLIFR